MDRKLFLGWWEYSDLEIQMLLWHTGKGMYSLDIEMNIVLFLSAYTSRCLDLKGKEAGKKSNTIQWEVSHHIKLPLFVFFIHYYIHWLWAPGMGLAVSSLLMVWVQQNRMKRTFWWKIALHRRWYDVWIRDRQPVSLHWQTWKSQVMDFHPICWCCSGVLFATCLL